MVEPKNNQTKKTLLDESYWVFIFDHHFIDKFLSVVCFSARPDDSRSQGPGFESSKSWKTFAVFPFTVC